MKAAGGIEFANTAEQIVFLNDLAVGEDGWAMIAPYGDFPGLATVANEDGAVRRFRAIQRLDRGAAETMVRHFKSLGGRWKRFLGGVPIFVGHPDAPGMEQRWPDRTPVGALADLEAREEGLYGLPVFTNTGLELVESKAYRALSGRWTAQPAGEAEGVPVFRPDELKSAGLTNNPNLPVELLNEWEGGGRGPAEQSGPASEGTVSGGTPAADSAAGSDQSTPMRETMLGWLRRLGVEVGGEAGEEEMNAALAQGGVKVAAAATLANEKESLAGELKNAHEKVSALEASVEAGQRELKEARMEFENERKARIALLLESAVRDGRATPAQTGDWMARLTADFANACAELAGVKPALKTRATTLGLGTRQPEVANIGDAAGRREQLRELLREELARNGGEYEGAWRTVERRHPGLFAAMGNGPGN